jgi:hypothetical protein
MADPQVKEIEIQGVGRFQVPANFTDDQVAEHIKNLRSTRPEIFGQAPQPDTQAMAAKALQDSGVPMSTVQSAVASTGKKPPLPEGLKPSTGFQAVMERIHKSPLGAPSRFMSSVAEDVPGAIAGMAKTASAAYNPAEQAQMASDMGTMLSSDAPTREKAGNLLGVNVEGVKQKADDQDYAGIAGKAVVPIAMLKAFGEAGKEPIPATEGQVAKMSSTLTQGAREAIPPVVKETLPALKQEAAATGIKVKNMDSMGTVVDSLDHKLESQFQQVKSQAQPTTQNIPGAQLATDALSRVEQKFPYLKQARPQAWQAIKDKLDTKFGNRNWSIEELDAERRALNDESASTHAQKQVTREQAMKDPELASDLMGAESVRDTLYNEIQNRTGQDMQSLKQQQSNLATLRRQIKIQKTELPNKQANAEATPYLEDVAGAHTAWEAGRKGLTGGLLEPVAKSNRRIRAAFASKVKAQPEKYAVLPAVNSNRER